MKTVQFPGCRHIGIFPFIFPLYCITATVSLQLEYGQNEFLPYPLQVQLKGSEICETEVCKEAATELQKSINMSVDPCEDFYQYACGNWIKNHPVPPSEASFSQFNIVNVKVDLEVKEVLEAEDSPNDKFPVTAAREAYRACMDTERVELEGLKLLSDFIESFGDWPMASEEWTGKGYNIQNNVVELLRLTGGDTLILSFVYLDRRNSSQSVIMIDQPSLSVARSMLVDPSTYRKQLEAYRKWIMGSAFEIIRSRNASVPRTRVSVDSYDVVEFEIKLAQITEPPETRRDATRTYNPMTLLELQNFTDSIEISNSHAKIDWLSFIEKLFTGIDVTFTSEERVIVKEVNYLAELVKLLDETSPRVLANYLQWRLVRAVSGHTTQKMKDLAFQFAKVYFGINERQPLWRECVSTTSDLLNFAVGYSYVSRFFNKESKISALEMVENIREQFSLSVSTLDWMDESTRLVAKDKAEAMTEIIGYPDWYSNQSAIDEYYKGVSVGPNHFGNFISLAPIGVRRILSKLRLPTDRTAWLTTPDTVNAYYNPQINSITFPAGILQPPFFKKGRPNALNYGSIGVVIGHEITHGFDDMGRQSDKYGNLAQWWSEATLNTYVQKTKCFVEQYGEYRVPELDEDLQKEVKMNGFITQGENMADNGGLRQAFLAYQKAMENNGPDERLPGLEKLSPQQLFFLGYATVWCESNTKQALLQDVLADSHSPNKFRVIGPLANSEEFAEAWNCPPGSPMNPPNKCQIW